MNNKAIAITAFIILGIVAILAVGTVIYIAQTSVETIDSYEEEIVDVQVQPVQTYVKQCINDLAVQAVKQAAQHGGYVFADQAGIYSIYNPVRNNAQSLLIDPQDSDSRVAYWTIISCAGEPSNSGTVCQFNNNIPDFSRVQTDVAKYVDENLEACLDDFSDFAIVYDITAKEPLTRVQFSDDQVAVITDFVVTLRSRSTGEQYTLNRFVIQKPTKFKQMYDSALELTAEQNKQRTIEYNVLEWIDAYSGINKERHVLPPKYKLDALNDPVSWTYDSAKSDFENMYASYLIPQFQVRASKNYVPVDDIISTTVNMEDSEKATYRLASFNEESASVQHFEYHFRYIPDWNMYFKINDRMSGNFGPETTSMAPMIPGLNLNVHEYVNLYSIEMPVIVQIVDNDVDDDFGNVLSFNVAWQTKIANNQPVGEENDISGEFSINNENASLFCDRTTWNEDASITFKDSYGNPVPNITATLDAGVMCSITADENGVVQGMPNGMYYLTYDNTGEYVLLNPVLMNLNPDQVYDQPVMLIKKQKPKLIELKKRYVTKEDFYYCKNELTDNQICMREPDLCIYDYDLINATLADNHYCIYNYVFTDYNDEKYYRTLSIQANSVEYWDVSLPQPLTSRESEAFVSGEYQGVADELAKMFVVQYDDTVDRFYTTGFIPGTYNMTLQYNDGSVYVSAVDSDMDNVAFTQFQYYVSDTLYDALPNNKMIVYLPVLDMTTARTLDDVAYAYEPDFMLNITHQTVFDNIPEDTFYEPPIIDYTPIDFKPIE